ncbi:hypothetical protein DPMN_103065 [Dreissena polymorpha]|uniref:Mab-21-like HhH/H2TH-like domain-containing protein n=1 Tax=Dreissena polymorpha TaxID=45954 RepID=A0A9D4JZS1_DREPO|nr:hypothetical protein DPMN_103065 [Dreissena polymorpha]
MERQIINVNSLKVCEVMEDIGVTEEIVNLRQYMVYKYEVRLPIKNNSLYNALLPVGSQVEGSTTIGMKSDTDIICVSCYVKVILQGQSEGCQGEALVVKDEMCCSQCCILQLSPIDPENKINFASNDDRFDETGHLFRDKQGRILVLNKPILDVFTSDLKKPTINVEQHGPAIRLSGSIQPGDFTLALHCPSLSEDCQVMFTRPKPGHWPKQQTITDAKRCGMFLIHPGNIGSTYDRCNSIMKIKFTSDYSLLQWRIATNTIERLLMFDLNIVQMRAYILTKMIRKEFLGPLVDNRLSTFHMKTSLFFTIEQFPQNIWRDDNIVQCVLYCLNTLRRFLKRRYCPHYTIASVNLFENKLEVFEMDQLETVISAMIHSKLAFVYWIQMDNFGQRLLDENNSQLSTKEENRSLIIFQFFFYNFCGSEIEKDVKQKRTFFNSHIEITSFALANDIAYRYELKKTLNDTFNQKASFEASRCIKNNIVISEAVYEMFRVSLLTGQISCYLKYASMLVCTQQYEKAESLLNEVYIAPDMVEFSLFLDDFKALGKQVKIAKSISPLNIMMDCSRKIVTPVSFSRKESHCLPKHLVYEMYRRNAGTSKSEYWKDNALINARPFLFYLQYLSSRHTHAKQVYVLNIEKYLTDTLKGRNKFNSHIETTLNILGHIHELENNIWAACASYAKSVFYVPNDNAALWHLFRLLGQQVYSKQDDTP